MLSIVVLTYNDPSRLRLCLHSLLRQTLTDFELIVVNDGGDRAMNLPVYEEMRLLGREIPEVWLGPESTEFRAAAARKVGLKQVHGERVLFLDGDSILAPDVLAGHAAYEGQNVLVNGARKHLPENSLAWLQPEHFAQLDQHVIGRDQRYDFLWPAYAVLRKQLLEGKTVVKLNHFEQVWSFQISLPTLMACVIGGFNEAFVGYGGEDQEMAGRMMQVGVSLLGRFDLISYHIDHPLRKPDQCNWLERVRVSLRNRNPIRNGGPIGAPNSPTQLVSPRVPGENETSSGFR